MTDVFKFTDDQRTGLSPANAGMASGVQNDCKTERHCAQRVSKIWGTGVQNGFVIVPSVPDGAVSRECGMGKRCPKCSESEKSEKSFEDIMFNVCPKSRNREREKSGDRMGTGQSEGKKTNRCVQRLSKVSESAVQNGFGVVPSVPDGAV